MGLAFRPPFKPGNNPGCDYQAWNQDDKCKCQQWDRKAIGQAHLAADWLGGCQADHVSLSGCPVNRIDEQATISVLIEIKIACKNRIPENDYPSIS